MLFQSANYYFSLFFKMWGFLNIFVSSTFVQVNWKIAVAQKKVLSFFFSGSSLETYLSSELNT